MQDRILLWLAGDETGVSSKVMAFCAVNINFMPLDHPLDPGDLHRCMLLVEQVPEIKEHFPRIAKLSDPWKNIIENWETLIQTLKSEKMSGDNMNETYNLLKTYSGRKL